MVPYLTISLQNLIITMDLQMTKPYFLPFDISAAVP